MTVYQKQSSCLSR